MNRPVKITRRNALSGLSLTTAGLLAAKAEAEARMTSSPRNEVFDGLSSSTAISQGNVPFYSSKAGMTGLTVPVGITALRVNGYAAAGDGGAAIYKRVASQPAHPGKFQSADGAWWEITLSDVIPVKAFGAKGDGVTDDAEAIRDALSYGYFVKRIAYTDGTTGGIAVDSVPVTFWGPGKYVVNSQINLPSSFDLVGQNAIISGSGVTGSSDWVLYCRQPYYCRIRGLQILGGYNGLWLDDADDYFALYMDDFQFSGQTGTALQALSTTNNAEIRLNKGRMRGAAVTFAKFAADSVELSNMSVYCNAVAGQDDTGSFIIQGRNYRFSDCIFTPCGTQASRARAWVSIEGRMRSLNFDGCSFGGETGRRCPLNVKAVVDSVVFHGCDHNTAADTVGQLSGQHIECARLYGDYLKNLVVLGGSGWTNGAILDFASGVTPTHRALASIALSNAPLATTPATFLNKINRVGGIVRRENSLDPFLRTSQVAAESSGLVVNSVTTNVIEVYFDVPATYAADGLSMLPSTGVYLFELMSGLASGGGSSWNVTVGLVGWFEGNTNKELFTNVLINKCDQTNATATITVTAVFAENNAAVAPMEPDVGSRHDRPVKGVILRFTMAGSAFSGARHAKVRPLFDSVSF
ncbi:hypothetical protein GCM10010869_00050 [Mesorhizobium tianshanense]|uniref:Pectate lyase-like protein n=1 Tax=Mesorhizobium tianshanense TaxID=39844 RepID=A0A562NRI2_9HYPH|nr:glycosyl hydrolase family 28-related protein [Mesorhizobium tianshanense]TWI34798.1 pectate lyase-like protein [Mesorhizobium tianshanense]GLS34417.1 hypothetical protein GCM10010869_00050 [Mesorhizobium tianshanense]